jgi:hypothetical protein
VGGLPTEFTYPGFFEKELCTWARATETDCASGACGGLGDAGMAVLVALGILNKKSCGIINGFCCPSGGNKISQRKIQSQWACWPSVDL